MKLPSIPKPPGQKRFQQSVQRHPVTLYKENYNLIPGADNATHGHLFMPQPKGSPAVPHQPKQPTGNVRGHWSGH